MFSDQTSSHFNLFLGKTDIGFYVPKMKKAIQTVATESAKTSLCEGEHQCSRYRYLHISEGTIDAKAYVGILERHMLPSRRRLFPGTPCLFQPDIARPHSAGVTRAWLRRHRVCVLNWPVCSPDLSHIESVWRIMKRRIRQRQPRTVEQLKSCVHQEWTKIALAKLQLLQISSVPNQLPGGKLASVPTFFECCRHQFLNLFIFNKYNYVHQCKH